MANLTNKLFSHGGVIAMRSNGLSTVSAHSEPQWIAAGLPQIFEDAAPTAARLPISIGNLRPYIIRGAWRFLAPLGSYSAERDCALILGARQFHELID
jgi:hypothetical protein